MRNHATTFELRQTVKWLVVGFSIFALACVAGTVAAGSQKDTGSDAKKGSGKVHVESKKSDRPFLGVTMQELDEDLRKGLDVSVKNGVLITDVVEDSPAQKAGIEEGDVVIEFDRQEVDSPERLRELVEGSGIGEAVKVKVVRDNKSKTFTVTIGTYPEDETWSFIAPEHLEWFDGGGRALARVFGKSRLGVRVTDINEDLGKYFGVKTGEGVLVLEVTEGSLGEKMGIKAGDVIVEIDDEKTGSVEHLRDAVADLEEGDEFTLSVVRSKKNLELAGEMDERAVRMYSGMMPEKFDVRVPRFEMRGVAGVEMENLKKEMKELKKELKNLKEELEKVKEST